MVRQPARRGEQLGRDREALSRITVSGFKSICDETNIEIKPLTILAGANSSGKSSIMQAVLLLKQTIEASFDPGPLLLNGTNVKFTAVDQILSSTVSGRQSKTFCVGVHTAKSDGIKSVFSKSPGKGLQVIETVYSSSEGDVSIHPAMTSDELRLAVRKFLLPSLQDVNTRGNVEIIEFLVNRIAVSRNRCFLEIALERERDDNDDTASEQAFFGLIWSSPTIRNAMRDIIHVPGLRGNPERSYPMTAVSRSFFGTFESYVASIIAQWSGDKDEKLVHLGQDLQHLGLTWKVAANILNDTQVELQVGRLIQARRGGSRDLVNIADVGFGVSQVLPVLVALHVARPGQAVYIEQPEIHLHPQAQRALADVLARAAQRGVRVIVETHSSILLTSIQSLVAEGQLDPRLTKLHWFTRDETGCTSIVSADLDRAGAYGDWPEDFGRIALEVQGRYLDAAEGQLLHAGK